MRDINNDLEKKKLCLFLLESDTEEEVIALLEKYGFWNDIGVWKDFGGYESEGYERLSISQQGFTRLYYES